MKKLVRVAGVILCAVAGVAVVSAVLGLTRIGACGGTGDLACPAGVGTDVVKIVGGAMALALGAVMTMGAGVLVACVTAAITLIVKGHGATPPIIGVALIFMSAAIFLLDLFSKRTARARTVKVAEAAGGGRYTTADYGPVGMADPGPVDAVPPGYSSTVVGPFSSGPEGIIPNVRVSGELVTSLERLAALRQSGSLSDDEYTLAKQRLLNGG